MIALICFVLAVLASPFKSNIRLEAENAVLRHQLIVLRRKLKGRARLTNNDRWFFVQLYRWFPSILPVLMIIRPETLVGWHRAGFRRYWRWKSCRRGGRPQIETELRALIRQMSTENLLWGAPRIHGELLKLGFSVAQSSVAKYMVERRMLKGRARLTNHDRWFFVQLYRWFPSILPVLVIIRPETLVRLASGRLSPLLVLEIALAGRAPANRDGAARADPADEHGEPALGCAAHPRRTA